MRITPAYAGKRFDAVTVPDEDEDHPRLCGEKSVYPFVGGCSNGITPAYAGKSFAFRLGGGGIRDHPRLCGEKPHVLPAYAA